MNSSPQIAATRRSCSSRPDAGGSMNTVRRAIGFAEQQDGFEDDTLHRRETLELVRAYYKIGDPAVRKRIFELTKSIAKSYRADED